MKKMLILFLIFGLVITPVSAEEHHEVYCTWTENGEECSYYAEIGTGETNEETIDHVLQDTDLTQFLIDHPDFTIYIDGVKRADSAQILKWHANGAIPKETKVSVAKAINDIIYGVLATIAAISALVLAIVFGAACYVVAGIVVVVVTAVHYLIDRILDWFGFLVILEAIPDAKYIPLQ